MLALRSLLGALALSLLLSASASAHEFEFFALLEPELAGATGSGSVTITLDVDVLTMHVEASWTGLSGTTTAAHLHCCTASPGVGDAGVATMLPSFTGFPLGVTSGTYDQTFDMNLASSWNPAFLAANFNNVDNAFNTIWLGLQNDQGYFNIHTTTFGGGEIRARLALVPEPGAFTLTAVGLAGLAALRRRARS
jgi:hypothetical protein